MELTGTPTVSGTQRKPLAGSGAPGEPTQRSDPRGGCRPALRQAMRKGAEVPKTLQPVSAATSHSAPRSGWAGSPSKRTTVAPPSRPDTREFNIIQPIVGNHMQRTERLRVGNTDCRKWKPSRT